MDILLDNPETDQLFQELLVRIRHLKNGETAAQMKALGVEYRINWGASVISLRELAAKYAKNHLLALKLWNKQWRETMILATLLEDPAELTEEQMDYWTKSFETPELAEQAVANLYVCSKFAFIKALEYCCGKKHLVRYTGLHLMGRLALVDKKAIDEMFDPFFDVILPLSKDPALGDLFYRSMLLLARRNEEMRIKCMDFLELVQKMEEDQPKRMAAILLDELKYLASE